MFAASTEQSWAVPPELGQPVPRRVKLSGTGIAYCVIALACLAFGIVMATRLVKPELDREAANDALARRLASEGRDSYGTVTALFTGLGHVVSYQYVVDGQSYKKSVFITLEHWNALQPGSRLPIHYLPSDPAESSPAADPPNLQKHWNMVFPMTGMVLFFMISFAAIQLRAVLPRRRLLSRGSPARGTVTGCRASQGRSGGYIVRYTFELPDGTVCQGKARRGSELSENSSVTVLYDPSRPRRNTLYPMETVKLASC